MDRVNDSLAPFRALKREEAEARNPRRGGRSSRSSRGSARCYFSRELRGRPRLAQQFPFYIQYLEISSGCVPAQQGKAVQFKIPPKKKDDNLGESKALAEFMRQEQQQHLGQDVQEKPFIYENRSRRCVASTGHIKWGSCTLIVGGLVVGVCLFGLPGLLDDTKVRQEIGETSGELSQADGTVQFFVEKNKKYIESYKKKGRELIEENFLNRSVLGTGGRMPEEYALYLQDRQKYQDRQNQHAIKTKAKAAISYVQGLWSSGEKSMSESEILQKQFVDLSMEKLLELNTTELNSNEKKTLRHLLKKYFTGPSMSQVKDFEYKGMYFRLLTSGKLPAYLTLGGHFLASLRPTQALEIMKGMRVTTEFQDFINDSARYADQNPSTFYSIGLRMLGTDEGADIPIHEYTQLELLSNQLYGNQYVQITTDETYNTTSVSIQDNQLLDSIYEEYASVESGSAEGQATIDSGGSNSIATQREKMPAERRAQELQGVEPKTENNQETRQSLFAENMDIGKQWIKAGEDTNNWSKRETATDSSTGEARFTVDQTKLLEYYGIFREGVIMLRGDNPVSQTTVNLQDYVTSVIVNYGTGIVRWAKDVCAIQLKRNKALDQFDADLEDSNFITSKLIEASAYGGVAGLGIAGVGIAIGSVAAFPATVIGLGLATGSFMIDRVADGLQDKNQQTYARVAKYVAEDDQKHEETKQQIGNLFESAKSNTVLSLPIPVSLAPMQIGDGTMGDNNPFWELLEEGQRYHPTNALCGWEFMDLRTQYFNVYCSEWLHNLKHLPAIPKIWERLGLPPAPESLKIEGSTSNIRGNSFEAEVGSRRNAGNTRPLKAESVGDRWNTEDPQKLKTAVPVFSQVRNPLTQKLPPSPAKTERTLSPSALEVVTRARQIMKTTGLKAQALKERTDLFLKVQTIIQEKRTTSVVPFLEKPSRTFLRLDGAPFPVPNQVWKIQTEGATESFPPTSDPAELAARYDFYAGTASLVLCLFHPTYYAYFRQTLFPGL